MTGKKSDGQARAGSPRSLASRLLGSAVRARLPVRPLQEPPRNQKPNDKFRSKRHVKPV
jgi:hypothetical protein